MYERLWPRCSHCPFQRELWLCCFCCPPLILGISTSGCSVQRYSHGTLEWEPTHGRAVVTRVVPTAPSSESCDLVVFVVLPFPWDLHLMVWPLSPAGFIVFFFVFFVVVVFFVFVCLFFFFPWHLSFSTVIQCDGCRTTPSVGSLGWYFGFASHGWIARTSRHPTSIRDVVVNTLFAFIFTYVALLLNVYLFYPFSFPLLALSYLFCVLFITVPQLISLLALYPVYSNFLPPSIFRSGCHWWAAIFKRKPYCEKRIAIVSQPLPILQRWQFITGEKYSSEPCHVLW